MATIIPSLVAIESIATRIQFMFGFNKTYSELPLLTKSYTMTNTAKMFNDIYTEEFYIYIPLYHFLDGKVYGISHGFVANEPVNGLYGIQSENGSHYPPKEALLFSFLQAEPTDPSLAFTMSFDTFEVQNTPVGLVGSPPGQGTTFYFQNIAQTDGLINTNITIQSTPLQYIINNPVNGLGGIDQIPEGYYDPYFTLVPKSAVGRNLEG